MAEFWTEVGRIETLGNSSIESDCTVYSVIQFRDIQGTLKSFSTVDVYRNVNTIIVRNHQITIYGFKGSERNVIYASMDGSGLSEDISEVQIYKRNIKLLSLLFIVMTMIAGITIDGIYAWIATIPLAVIFFRDAAKIPTVEEMRAQIRTNGL